MTGKVPVLEPYEDSFAVQEEAMANFRGPVVEKEEITRGRIIINTVSTTSKDLDVIDFADDDNFYNALISTVKVKRVGVPRVCVSKGKKVIKSSDSIKEFDDFSQNGT